MQKWDYCYVIVRGYHEDIDRKTGKTKFQEVIDKGREGWELVGISHIAAGVLSGVQYVFKRPIEG